MTLVISPDPTMRDDNRPAWVKNDYGKGNSEMKPININRLIEFNDQKFNPVVLANEPEMRLVLLCLRAGQQVPEHSANGIIMVQCITGHATFYDGTEACEMFAGTLARIGAGRPHRVEAHQDAVLLVTMLKTRRAAVSKASRDVASAVSVLDLREIPRAMRHLIVLDAFDSLSVGDSFILVNDHDPQPLRMQIEQMRDGEMRWEYIERGPEAFRIHITRVAQPAGNAGPVNTGTAESPAGIGLQAGRGGE
jgi:uncharacterized protein (DUF2249 family)/quercetin dioxygenase-like cupin family protein